MTWRMSASLPSALPVMVNSPHLLTTTPEGINSYQDVPITISKEEGRMSPTLGVERAGEAERVSFLESQWCLGQSCAPAGDETSGSPWVPVRP